MLECNVPRRDGQVLASFIFGCMGNFDPGLKTAAATERKFFESYAKEDILPDYWNQDARLTGESRPRSDWEGFMNPPRLVWGPPVFRLIHRSHPETLCP
jgi:hypothetical protein